jgi:hypothetical protein
MFICCAAKKKPVDKIKQVPPIPSYKEEPIFRKESDYTPGTLKLTLANHEQKIDKSLEDQTKLVHPDIPVTDIKEQLSTPEKKFHSVKDEGAFLTAPQKEIIGDSPGPRGWTVGEEFQEWGEEGGLQGSLPGGLSESKGPGKPFQRLAHSAVDKKKPQRISIYGTVFGPENQLEAIYQSRIITLSRPHFALKSLVLLQRVAQYLTVEDANRLLRSIRRKLVSHRDTCLLYMCIVKQMMQPHIPKLVVKTAWISAGSVTEEILRNLQRDELLQYWNVVMGLDSVPLESQYDRLSVTLYSKRHEITKDVTRTFPEFYHSESRKQILHEVLQALGNAFPVIGYVQGLNSIVGGLMMYLSQRLGIDIDRTPKTIPKLTYLTMKYLLERRSLRLMFERSFYGFNLVCLQVKLWLRVMHPELAERLASLDFDYTLLLSRWVINLFSSVFPLEFLITLINYLLVDGLSTIVRLTVAMLGLADPEVYSCHSDPPR